MTIGIALAVGIALLVTVRRWRRRRHVVDRVSDHWLDEHHRY